MKNFLLILLLLFPVGISAQVNVDEAYCYSPATSTGLSAVYVVRPESSVTLRYTSYSTDEISWYRFDQSGSSSQTELLGTQSGNYSTLVSAEKDCGYIVKQNTESVCFWVSSYQTVSSCAAADEQDNICEKLLLVGEGFAIPYYTVNGQVKYLPRRVSYDTYRWDDISTDFNQFSTVVEGSVLSDGEMEIPVPYGTTSFTVIDSIPLAWGGSIVSTLSDAYVSSAVLIHAEAEQSLRGALNEAAEQPTSGFGGSAPVEMTFTAYCIPRDSYYAWEFSSDEEFSDVDIFTDQQLSYAFKEEGTTYVRLHAYNDYCDKDTVFEISVGESKLEAPNVFSPYGSPGVNDEWKVAYKSIVEFKCWIFNRWGEQLYFYQDPAGGWDGYYHGKLVPPGVYYYVIEARGADNQKYKLKGHINILRSKNQ
ncbi:MAG: gliding motility-associated C-terminal domain-containing protein [Porphyromonadaceae bacterium]|nr:gliding motility-associated C-terminal domain-containing protein [Porphyromonadaceae bacterium]